MEARAAAIAEGRAGELVWLLEHPALYTAGVSAKPGDLLEPDRFPVFQSGRGGQFTYHGPGQRVAYVMLDLTKRERDVPRLRGRAGGLGDRRPGAFQRRGRGPAGPGRRLGRTARRRPPHARGQDRRHRGEAASLGLVHGISLNVEPDLAHFGGIVPCGVTDHGVTSWSTWAFPSPWPKLTRR